MEEVAEGFIKVILKGILSFARLLVYVSWELMYEKISWYLGWPVVRIITIGYYPKEGISDEENAPIFIHFLVSLIGIAYPIIIAYYLTTLLLGK